MSACCGCGESCDDPYYTISYGLGGTGTKADDFHVIPVCCFFLRDCIIMSQFGVGNMVVSLST
ncbi:DUF968 domain-containing protein [Citrobacter freundii]|nr:DUF968 domain-containing protein [Citrobacter freundii]